MTLTTLDKKTALIVIDLQAGILKFPTVHPIADILKNASTITTAFRRHKLPVVLVNVDRGAPGRTEHGPPMGTMPAEWIALAPELNQQPEDHTVTKKRWGAFTETDLEDYLTKKQVTQVVIIGVATSIGVESTARYASEIGFNVTLATDAMTDLDPDAHANSIKRIFPRLGETGTTQDIIDLLDKTHG